MPLIQSASRGAVSDNIRREMDAGKPQRQAVAIALATQRRNRGRAAGGIAGPDSFARGAMHSIARAGLIHSPVAGRTDHIPMHVPSGSYVLPADHVSGLGQGNTLAGGKLMDRMFKTPSLHSTIPRPPPIRRAYGGGVHESVPIVVAGGEYLLHPDQVRLAGNGDLNQGHDALDAWVKGAREKHIKTLSKLPGPKK